MDILRERSGFLRYSRGAGIRREPPGNTVREKLPKRLYEGTEPNK